MTTRQRLSLEVAKKKVQQSAAKASEGDWEALNYTGINAEKMRKFLSYINVTGTSLKCEQESVDAIEAELRKHKTFDSWSKDKKIALDGERRGFVYLFTTK